MNQPTPSQAQPAAIETPSPTPDPPGELTGPPREPETRHIPLTLPPQLDIKPGTLSSVPPLPPDLAAALTPRERSLLLELVKGSSWGEAVNTVLGKRATRIQVRLKAQGPSKHLRAAAEWTVRDMARAAGITRDWITIQLVSLYVRAVQAEPVYDKKGRETGVYKFDGMTARGCLDLLGRDLGMFGAGKGSGIPAGSVVELLQAVAARGKQALPGDERAALQHAPQAVDSTAGAPQHENKPGA